MIRKRNVNAEIVIDLSGPAGNAYALIGQAQRFAGNLAYTREETEEMVNDMMASDYEHLVEVFDKHFGDVVILER
jgi:hypothetical protein